MIADPAAPPAPFKTFEIRPQLVERGKTNTKLAAAGLISAGVQVIGSGGETNLHGHDHQDAIWLVLNGKVRFYTEGDQEVATLGKFEGLVIPRGSLYWFESASEENLVIVRIAATDPRVEAGRTDKGERVSREILQMKDGQFFEA